MKLYILLLYLFVSAWSISAKAQVVYENSEQRISIVSGLYVFKGEEHASFDEVLKSNSFQGMDDGVPNLGISYSNKWFKLPITNKSSDSNLLLEIAYPLLDEVEFFTPNSDGTYSSIKLGESKAFSERKYKVPNYVFNVDIEQDETKVFFLRVCGTEQIILPIFLSNKLQFSLYTNTDNLLNGIYIGIVIIMAIYNLFLFFSVRDIGYLYYVLYVICAGITQMSIKGYSFQYLWPLWPQFSTIGPIIFGCLSGLAALLFADSFLHVEKNFPRARWIFNTFIVLFIICTVIAILGGKQVAFLGMQVITGIASLFVLYISYRVMLNGYKPARYFVLGWTILLVGSLIFLLKDSGVLKYNDFTSNIVQLASVIEMALLSFGLAYSINILKAEKEVSQARELAISLENEKLIREQNVVLEYKVDERTRELQASNNSLQTTLTHLKETQSQLVEAEKMASLGQLTAGVAHEINNPINFVTANVAPLKRDVKMIWDTVDEIERIALDESLSLKDKEAQIKAFKDDLDFDYLRTEVDYLLKGMHDGASRTAEIVKSLRIFSRVDEDSLTIADINEGLESTLVILSSAMKEKAIVNKVYGKLPLIECYAGKLNQVFLNILTNALHAVGKKYKGNSGGVLEIETGIYESDKSIFIKIADNGTGIPKDIREKIFEPFFTTKDVGEGTGLGMSIAYNTIAKHNGKIIVESEEGQYTIFTIVVPIKQNS